MSTEIHFRVQGRVQGVMFRQTLIRAAQRRGLQAGASNVGDGAVVCVLKGDATAIEAILAGLKRGDSLNSWGAQVRSLVRIEPSAGLALHAHQVTTDNVDRFRWNPRVNMFL